jgi:hypothetical protein
MLHAGLDLSRGRLDFHYSMRAARRSRSGRATRRGLACGLSLFA